MWWVEENNSEVRLRKKQLVGCRKYISPMSLREERCHTDYEKMIAMIRPNIHGKRLLQQLDHLRHMLALECLNDNNSNLWFDEQNQRLGLKMGSFDLYSDAQITIISRFFPNTNNNRINYRFQTQTETFFSEFPRTFHWTDLEIKHLCSEVERELNSETKNSDQLLL